MARGRRQNHGRNNRSNNRENARARTPSPEPEPEPESNANEEPSYASMYPPGCLHTLMEQERDSPEMNRRFRIMGQFAVFQSSYQGSRLAGLVEFWDHPENRVFVNNDLVRQLFFFAIKAVTLKEQFGENWKRVAQGCIRNTLPLFGALKCGSMRAFGEAYTQYVQGRQIDGGQARAVFAVKSVTDLLEGRESHLGLLYVLDQITPCNCLKQEIRQEEQKLVREGNHEECFVCSVCNIREEQARTFKLCRPCGMRCYCSHECHVRDWREGVDGMKHKDICPILREILEFRIEPLHESVE